MKRTQSIQKMTSAALLIAIGIIIPLFSPVKVPIGPAGSFTLASHVAIFLGMFMSPVIAASVAAGTTIGFLAAGFPPVVVLRAATHLIFAVLGAWWLKKHPETLASPAKTIVFAVVISLLHATAEVAASAAFYFGGGIAMDGGFIAAILVPVGVVTVVHSLVDFGLSVLIVKALGSQKSIAPLFMGTPYGTKTLKATR